MKYVDEDGCRRRCRRTRYGGELFRSRLESLWARRFDELDINWSYEPCRYYFGDRSYLPDFWLPQFDCHIEVKPADPTYGQLRLACLLVEDTRDPLYFLIGIPQRDFTLKVDLSWCCGRWFAKAILAQPPWRIDP